MKRVPIILALGTIAAALMVLPAMAQPQDPRADALKAALAERFAAAKEVTGMMEAARERTGTFGAGDLDSELQVLWSRRLAEASAESGASTDRASYGEHLARLTKQMQSTKVLHDVDRVSAIEVAVMRYHVAEARVLVERSAGK